MLLFILIYENDDYPLYLKKNIKDSNDSGFLSKSLVALI